MDEFVYCQNKYLKWSMGFDPSVDQINKRKVKTLLPNKVKNKNKSAALIREAFLFFSSFLFLTTAGKKIR